MLNKDKKINDEENEKSINKFLELNNDKKIDDDEINEEINDDEINEEINEELNNEELNNEEIADADFDIIFKNSVNKHKLEGTHSLKRDTIFMGKLEEEQPKGLETSIMQDFDTDNYNIEKGSTYEMESKHYEDYYYTISLTNDVYELLEEKTEIIFLQNRRKPNKQTFNKYYEMCIKNLSYKYTKSEIFVELSYYFTDNIFNMFKLLNKKNATGIILELKNKGYLTDIGNINFI
jgi:hypothetical protein